MSVHATRRRERSFGTFARRLRNALGEAIHETILYGSTARGEATESSDVDVLVVFEEPIESEHREVVSRIAFEVGLEYDVAITYQVQSKARFDARQDSPYLKNVLQDGRFHE